MTTKNKKSGAAKTSKSNATSKLVASYALQATNKSLRTFKIEAVLIAATKRGEKLKVRDVERICDQLYTNNDEGREDSKVKAVRMHMMTLYNRQLIAHENHAYYVRPEVLKLVDEKNGGAARYNVVEALHATKKKTLKSAPAKVEAPAS